MAIRAAMNKRRPKAEIARIVREELPMVKTRISAKRVGAGRLIVKATPHDILLSANASKKIAALMDLVRPLREGDE